MFYCETFSHSETSTDLCMGTVKRNPDYELLSWKVCTELAFWWICPLTSLVHIGRHGTYAWELLSLLSTRYLSITSMSPEEHHHSVLSSVDIFHSPRLHVNLCTVDIQPPMTISQTILFPPPRSPLPSLYFPGPTFKGPNHSHPCCTTMMAVVIPRVFPVISVSKWATSESGLM
jgi:hypothetical protein